MSKQAFAFRLIGELTHAYVGGERQKRRLSIAELMFLNCGGAGEDS